MPNKSFGRTTLDSGKKEAVHAVQLSLLLHEKTGSVAEDPRARSMRLKDGTSVWLDEDDYQWAKHYEWGHHRSKISNGYARRWGFNGEKMTNILLHREITRCPKGFEVDHINHDTADNRRANLRIVTSCQNGANALKTRSRRTSNYKGVSLYKRDNNWCAQIIRNGKYFFLGRYDTEAEAAAVYNAKALELSAEYSVLNIIKA